MIDERSSSTGRERAARWIGIALVLATLANGGATWLKRIGVAEPETYARYMGAYCATPTDAQRRPWTDCACVDIPDDAPVAVSSAVPDRAYLYRNEGVGWLAKLAKDGLLGVVLLATLGALVLRRVPPPAPRAWVPLAGLGVSLAIGFGIALAEYGAKFALAGLRGFGFVALAALGGWLARELRPIAGALAALLVLEVVAVAAELAVGMPIRSCPHSFRSMATLVMPNSLGVFAAVALAFCLAFAPRHWRWGGVPAWPVLAALALLLVFAGGSATGLVAMFVLGAWMLAGHVGSRGRLAFGAASLATLLAIVAALPTLTQRPDLFGSVLAENGRVDKLRVALASATPREMLIGHGLGYGTNTAAILATEPAADGFAAPRGMPDSLDSTVTALFVQLGAVGVLAFYALLAWAAARDARARPVYVVLALSSLMISLGELFPVNFVLGLCLAHSLAARRA